jgi:pimeloyl-ACP methyl ester carboxylesterase
MSKRISRIIWAGLTTLFGASMLPAQAQTVVYDWDWPAVASGPIQGAFFPSEATAAVALDKALGYPSGGCSASNQTYDFYGPVGDWGEAGPSEGPNIREYNVYVEQYATGCVPTLTESPTTTAYLSRGPLKSPYTTSLVDPVPVEVNGSGVNADANGLAAISSTVVGMAADGTTEIVVRISIPSAGTAVQLSLADENNNPAAAGSGNALGYLTTLLPSDGTYSTAGGRPITVTTVSTGNGAMAFAVYHAPLDFVRDGNARDPSLPTRNVFVEISTGGTIQTEQSIEIVRPPVVFIHGIWGTTDDGDDILSSLMSDGVGLTAYALGYEGTVEITSSIPSYGSNLTVSGSSLGFSFAASIVLPELYDAIADYRINNTTGQQIATAQADIVAHSMGGDVARYLPSLGGFSRFENYDKGPIHKLITIGTPHLGSPLALDLLDGSNSCVVWILRKKQRYAFTSATLSSGITYDGGIADLQGSLDGTSLSRSLMTIQPNTTEITTQIPTAMVAASMSSSQLEALNSPTSPAQAIKALCDNLATIDPLAAALTSNGWPGIVGSESDAIVPVNSQIAGPSGKAASPLGAEVHSPGTEALGFAGPSELDDTAVIPPEILQLLNTPVNQPVFAPLP